MFVLNCDVRLFGVFTVKSFVLGVQSQVRAQVVFMFH